jgi:hypothetical protein
MAIEKIVNIVINELGIDSAIDNTQRLEKGLDSVGSSSASLAGGMKDSTNSVLENGGAMGLLNDATGGLAMTVKDAVEATALFAKESKISTFIQGAYATVIGTSTGAMKAFKVALIGTGIGALVVGLILLITNFDKVKAAVYNLIPGLKNVGEFVGNIINAVTDFIGVTSEAERAFARLTEQADKSLAKNKKFLAEQGSQLDEFTKRKIESNNKYNEAIKEQGADVIALAKEQNREIAKIDADRDEARTKKRKEAQDKIDTENQRAADKAKVEREKQKAIADKLAEDKKKLLEDNLKAENEFQIALNNAKFEQSQIDQDNLNRQIEAIEEFNAKKEKADQDAADKEIEFQIDKDNAIANSRENLNNIIDGLETSGIAKTKAGQIASKAIALTQIAIDSAVAISKASTLANAEGVAAQLAFPLVPGAGTIARIVSYASTAASVIGNISVAKRMLSSGGGSASISPSSGGSQQSAPPQFNIVGQNSNNQLAQTIGTQQNRPIEAFVVSGNVTNAQQLDRNRINTATFGS